MTTFIYGVEIEAENREQANAMMEARLADYGAGNYTITGWALARVNPWPEIIDDEPNLVGRHA